MTGWVILVDQPRDLPNAETPHKVITTSEYLARPRLFDMGRPKLVNLSRSYAYQSKGYYASLLAEARGHRVVPTVETMLELREQKLYEHALPDLEEELNKCARRADFQPDGEFKLLVCFGLARDEPVRAVRPPAVRLVPLPRAGSDHRTGRAALHRSHPPAQHHPARQWRRRVFPRVAAQSHQAGVARSQGALGRQVRSRGALRSEREREDGAVVCRARSSISPASPRNYRSTSNRSPSASSPNWPSSTGCSFAKPRRSIITPTGSPAAPGRKACRSSTIRSR